MELNSVTMCNRDHTELSLFHLSVSETDLLIAAIIESYPAPDFQGLVEGLVEMVLLRYDWHFHRHLLECTVLVANVSLL